MVNLEGNKKTQHSSPLWLFCNIMHFSGMERENEKKNVWGYKEFMVEEICNQNLCIITKLDIVLIRELLLYFFYLLLSFNHIAWALFFFYFNHDSSQQPPRTPDISRRRRVRQRINL